MKTTRFGQRARSGHSKKNAAREREPWLLATSLPAGPNLAKRVVGLYATRMQIEEAFRDIKSARYGLSLEYSGTRQLQRLQVLLLIGSWAKRRNSPASTASFKPTPSSTGPCSRRSSLVCRSHRTDGWLSPMGTYRPPPGPFAQS